MVGRVLVLALPGSARSLRITLRSSAGGSARAGEACAADRLTAAAAAADARCRYGTRLRPLTLTVPKPIIDFGTPACLPA